MPIPIVKRQLWGSLTKLSNQSYKAEVQTVWIPTYSWIFQICLLMGFFLTDNFLTLPNLFKTYVFFIFLLILVIIFAVLRVFNMFTGMKISPSVGYTWRRFGRWVKWLGERPSSLIMLPRVKPQSMDCYLKMCFHFRKEESLLCTSKSLLGAQDDYDWRTSPDDDFIRLFPRFVPVLHTT